VEWIHAGKSEAVSFRARAICGCLTCRRLALSISLEAEEREDSARARRGVVILETLPLGVRGRYGKVLTIVKANS